MSKFEPDHESYGRWLAGKPSLQDTHRMHQCMLGVNYTGYEICGACNGAGGSYNGPCWDCQGQGAMPIYEDKAMNAKEAITLIQITNGASIFSAEYLHGNSANLAVRTYHFKNALGTQLANGDLVVVETRDTFALAKVVEANVRADQCGCDLAQLKHLACKVDLAALAAVQALENSAAHKLAMAEVYERLAAYQTQLGATQFDAIKGTLIGRTPEQDTIEGATE